MGGSWAKSGMPEPLTTTSYDANNRQLTFGDKMLAYDDNGNLKSITDSNGTTLYTWNARNQLVGIAGPNVNATFLYAGAGRRKRKIVNGSLTEFRFDHSDPVQETSGSNVLANVLTGLNIDEAFMRTDVSSGIASNILTDVLGTTIALTDAAGSVRTEYNYEAFGRTSTTGDSNNNPFQFTQRENDGTGFYYYRARYYHPGLQRFMSEDPIRFMGGDLNLYAYVANKPADLTDPFGLRPPVGRPPGSQQPPYIPTKTPWEEAADNIGNRLDDLNDRGKARDEWDDGMDRETEIRKKLSGLDPECDTWCLSVGLGEVLQVPLCQYE